MCTVSLTRAVAVTIKPLKGLEIGFSISAQAVRAPYPASRPKTAPTEYLQEPLDHRGEWAESRRSVKETERITRAT